MREKEWERERERERVISLAQRVDYNPISNATRCCNQSSDCISSSLSHYVPLVCSRAIIFIICPNCPRVRQIVAKLPTFPTMCNVEILERRRRLYVYRLMIEFQECNFILKTLRTASHRPCARERELTEESCSSLHAHSTTCSIYNLNYTVVVFFFFSRTACFFRRKSYLKRESAEKTRGSRLCAYLREINISRRDLRVSSGDENLTNETLHVVRKYELYLCSYEIECLAKRQRS